MNDRDFLEKLVERAKNGDERAFEEICLRFRWLIVKNCRRTYIRGYDMDDLIQLGNEALVNAVRKYENRGTGFTAYVRSAVQRKLFYCIRSCANKPACCSIYSVNDEGEELVNSLVSMDEDDNLEERLIYREKIQALEKFMGMLPEKYRDIITSYFFNGISLKEYASIKHMSYRNAVFTKKKALEKLRSLFEKFYK